MIYAIVWIVTGILGAMGNSYASARLKRKATPLAHDIVCTALGPIGLLVGATNFAACKGFEGCQNTRLKE